MNTLLLVYLALFFGGGIGFWIVREVMMMQAGTKLSAGDKIQRTMWSRTGLKWGEMSRMWGVHRQFFPQSSLRFWYKALWVFTILWMFFGLSLLRH
jgi:hypothetical protein